MASAMLAAQVPKMSLAVLEDLAELTGVPYPVNTRDRAHVASPLAEHFAGLRAGELVPTPPTAAPLAVPSPMALQTQLGKVSVDTAKHIADVVGVGYPTIAATGRSS